MIALLAISSAGVLVRGTGDAHPLVVAFWRALAAALLLAPTVRSVRRADAARIAIAGLLLAIHFGTWFASLHATTILRSTLLVTLAPVWAGAIEAVVLKRPPPRHFWIGVGVAMAGVAILGNGEGAAPSLKGDVLALVGGLAGAGYFLLGRKVREHVAIGTYASLVCAAAAVSLLPVVLTADLPLTGFDTRTWAFIGALALGPQLLGHSGINYALRWVPAARLTSLTLLEPVGAALLAWAFLGEVPSALAWLGSGIAVVGILIAASPRSVFDRQRG
ncbi:MAG: EamA family transporter [Proteobacteria bacterium]|nr:EamA family transporter [Pseudomonadota bacterium]